MSTAEKCYAALNRLAKWRSVFAGWQLGTRTSDDPECQAVRDHREVTILLRAEMNALLNLCINNGVCTIEDWYKTLAEEAERLSKDYKQKFPGMRAIDIGIQYDARAAETMKHWRR